jgi:hypothetical protein
MASVLPSLKMKAYLKQKSPNSMYEIELYFVKIVLSEL